ncbi:MAG: response regulator [Flavobacteriales bacterium]|nr:response regulator [Flavobacteriales bacterium]
MTNEPLTAVLVDDEEHCTDTLAWMLGEYCPSVKVQQVFNDPAAALKYLQHDSPDLLFLDIEMPVLNQGHQAQRIGLSAEAR